MIAADLVPATAISSLSKRPRNMTAELGESSMVIRRQNNFPSEPV